MPVPQREQGFVVSWSDEGGYRRKGFFWSPSEATFGKQKCVLMYWFHILWWWSAPALLPSLLPETEMCFTSVGYHSSVLFQLLMKDWASVMVIYKGGGELVDTSIQTLLCSTHWLAYLDLMQTFPFHKAMVFELQTQGAAGKCQLAPSPDCKAVCLLSELAKPAAGSSSMQRAMHGSGSWLCLFVCCRNDPEKAKTHLSSGCVVRNWNTAGEERVCVKCYSGSSWEHHLSALPWRWVLSGMRP